MTKISKIIYFVLTSFFLLFFNLYFSNLILNSFRFNFKENPILDLIFVQNTGAAFSILENAQVFLIIFSVITILMILLYTIKSIEKLSTIALFWLSMLTAGIFCNLYERLAYGYVRDFFKLNFIDFPVFNISDIFINIGVLALIVLIVKKKFC